MDLIDQMFENGIDKTGVRVCHFGRDENGVSGVHYTTYTEDGERIDEFVPWEDMVQPDTYSTPESISSMTYYQFVVLYGCARNKVGQNATPETVMNYFAQHWYTLVKERDDLWNSFPHGLLPMPVRKSEYTPPTISSMTYEESYALYQSFQTYADDEANAAFRVSNVYERVARILLGIPTEYYYSMDQLNEYLANHPLEPADLTDTINNSDGPALALNVDWEYNSIYGPGNFTVNIDPEYAKQLEEQFSNVKIRLSGYGRGPALIKFIYDSDEAETPSGYELVRNELWSGSESCTDEQIADIARYMISDIFNEQQKAQMLEAVDAFLAKEEQTLVAAENPAMSVISDVTADLIAGLKSYLEEIAPKMSDIDSLTDEEVASFNETLKMFKEVITDTGLDSATLDPRTDTGMNLETLDPNTDTSLIALLDSYIASLDEKEAKTADTTVTDTINNLDGPALPLNVDLENNHLYGPCGPGSITVTIDPEYAKQLEEQFKNVKIRVGGYGRGQAFFKFIYDSDEAETPSGYELVRTESWSGSDCTDEQIADIARYIITHDISDEQQKALMLEAVDAFLAKGEQTSVADGTPNYTPVVTYSQIPAKNENEAKTADTTVSDPAATITVTDPAVADINNYLCPGVRIHMVKYGETQEYLESLANEGYFLGYHKDNPPEEGKLTVAKPNAMPEWMKDYATNVVYDEYGNFISCSLEGLITPAENPTLSVTSDVTADTTTDPAVATNSDPAAADINNYLCPGVRIHIVQYGETQEYLESLANEGYFLGYHKDNPPEEGKLTISKPNPEPDPITITAVADPISFPQGLVLSVDLTEEEIVEINRNTYYYSPGSPIGPLFVRDYGEGWSVIGRGDFNGNGTYDVLVANPTAASDTVGLIGYWDNDSEWNLIGGYSPEWDVLATADFNGDGKTDILWRNSFVGEDGNTYNAYCTWIMDEADGWRMVSASNADEWDFLCTGDFDGDGTKDIAMINASGLVSVWGISDGRLGADAVLSAVDTSEWKFAGVCDHNSDGTDDIMWAHTDGTAFADRYGFWQIDDGQLASWESISSSELIYISKDQYFFATLA